MYGKQSSYDRDRAVWQFRFDICDAPSRGRQVYANSNQIEPWSRPGQGCWWLHKTKPSPGGDLGEPEPTTEADKTWSLDPACGSLSTTLRLDRVQPARSPSATAFQCQRCRAISERVYLDQDICLNEYCRNWFIEAANSSRSGKSLLRYTSENK